MIKKSGKSRKKLTACIIVIILSVGTYFVNLYATKSQPVLNQSEVKWLQSIPVAHRGLHSNNAQTPENSIAAFEEAIKSGYTIEFDVQLSTDKKVVIFHDYSLKRMTGVDKKVVECAAEELSKLKLMGSEHKIPLLKDVLKLVDGKVPLLIEVKNEGIVGELEKALYDELKDYKGKYAVQSFNPYVLKWFRENAPQVVRGQLAGGFKKEDLAWYKKLLLKNLMLNFESKPAFIAYEIDELPKSIVKRLSENGTIVLGWTARTKEEYNKALKDCDNIIFEGFIP